MKIKDLTITAMFSALIFIATSINFRIIPVTSAGLVHFGTPLLIIAALVFGKQVGAFSGAIGMTLFDIFSGYALYAPVTFVARFIMGYVIGKYGYNQKIFRTLLVVIIASLIMMFIYFIGAIFITGSIKLAALGLIGDFIQVCFGLIGIPIAFIVKKSIY